MSLHLPPALIASLQKAKGFDEPAFANVHEFREQVTSIRINPAKFSIQHSAFSISEKVPWSSNGYYLSERPSFTLDPLFHAGAYYVQEASSMFLEEVVKQTCDFAKTMRVLDLCAAPGGKSTLLQSIISEDSLLVSNEVIKTRVNILSENITKWGAANVVVTNNDPKDFQRLGAWFDLIVIDAPCSGSGLFRRDAGAIDEWSPENVTLCSQRQQRILSDILPSLKPGGILIYSTCSYSTEEDEDICDWLLSGSSQQLTSKPLHVNEEWNIVETISAKQHAFAYRFYPYKVRGEGFFIAAFQKNEQGIQGGEIKMKNKPIAAPRSETAILKPLIKKAETFSFIKLQEDILAIPSSILADVLLLQSVLYLKKAGIKTGTIIRNEFIPAHEFALSTIINPVMISIDTGLETALQYLRRDNIHIETGDKGWVLLKYKDLPLGWIKVLGNRINNYYPKDWRILNK